MTRNLFVLSCTALLFACTATGKTLDAANDDTYRSRLVAIGDIHGDYQQFVKLLQTVGLVDKRNKWIGGDSRLVQLGDIPDRGPDTRKAMDLLMELEKSAAKAGGSVTALIGNHESMNMTDDLRYVHSGEYAAFKGRNSRKNRNAYYQATIAHLTTTLSKKDLPVFDKAHREQWNVKFPLGYVEHRRAWAPSGKYGKWVLSHPAVAVLDDTLFVHGGISAKYANMPVSEMNTRIRTELANSPRVLPDSVIDDVVGPLWHRSWTSLPEIAENESALDAVLAALGVRRMVVAHTPLLPIVLPRFGGKLVMVDVGLSAAYGGGFSALELVGGEAFAIIADGRVALPTESGVDAVLSYLTEAEEIVGPQVKITNYRELLLAPPAVEQQAAPLAKQTVK